MAKTKGAKSSIAISFERLKEIVGSDSEEIMVSVAWLKTKGIQMAQGAPPAPASLPTVDHTPPPVAEVRSDNSIAFSLQDFSQQ